MTAPQSPIDYGERGKIQIVDDARALARAAAELFVSRVRQAVEHRGEATVALSGGSTPKQMGQLLADAEFRSRVPWNRLRVFWGDERWVPLDSPESNAGEAIRTFLSHVGIAKDRIHPFETVGVTPEESAQRYEQLIAQSVPGLSSPIFDLVLLGMGDDGHTASLFPHTPAIYESERLVAPNFVPKLETTRLTFTPPLINAAREVAFLAAGENKAQRLAEVVEGPLEPERLPSQTVRPEGGPLWLVDRAAARSLSKQPE